MNVALICVKSGANTDVGWNACTASATHSACTCGALLSLSAFSPNYHPDLNFAASSTTLCSSPSAAFLFDYYGICSPLICYVAVGTLGPQGFESPITSDFKTLMIRNGDGGSTKTRQRDDMTLRASSLHMGLYLLQDGLTLRNTPTHVNIKSRALSRKTPPLLDGVAALHRCRRGAIMRDVR